jgi:hypothetical protein
MRFDLRELSGILVARAEMKAYVVQQESVQLEEAMKGTDLVHEAREKFFLFTSNDVMRGTVRMARRTGSIAISRRPKPWRSGSEGCAPTATPCSLACATVAFMIEKSLAWKPQAMLARSMVFMRASSSAWTKSTAFLKEMQVHSRWCTMKIPVQY